MSVTVTIPSALSIKMRFPEFADVADAVIEFAIDEAREEVGSNWTTGYNIAIVYLVAHYVAASIAATAMPPIVSPSAASGYFSRNGRSAIRFASALAASRERCTASSSSL